MRYGRYVFCTAQFHVAKMERPALARLLNYRWQHHCHGRFFHNRIVCSYLWHNLWEKVDEIMLCSTPTLLIYKIIASGRHFVQLMNKIMPNTNALSRLPIGLCRCLQNVNKPCSEVLPLCSPTHMHTHSPSLFVYANNSRRWNSRFANYSRACIRPLDNATRLALSFG